jgi:hypothetical protein
VFAVLKGPLRFRIVSYIGHGSVMGPNHARVAQVLIADDYEVGLSRNYAIVRTEFSASQYSGQADSRSG